MSAIDQMPPDEVRDEIARLESRIEALTDSIERCRKLSLLARAVLVGGGVWIALIVVRILPFAPFHIVGAIAAVIGGIVLFGSNASTRRQCEAERAEAGARRSGLIDRIEPRVVEAKSNGSGGNVVHLFAPGSDRPTH
jgi:hypothetical protein